MYYIASFMLRHTNFSPILCFLGNICICKGLRMAKVWLSFVAKILSTDEWINKRTMKEQWYKFTAAIGNYNEAIIITNL